MVMDMVKDSRLGVHLSETLLFMFLDWEGEEVMTSMVSSNSKSLQF